MLLKKSKAVDQNENVKNDVQMSQGNIFLVLLIHIKLIHVIIYIIYIYIYIYI